MARDTALQHGAADDADIDGFFSTARVSGRETPVLASSGSFRDFVFDTADPAVAQFRGLDYQEFAAKKKEAPFLRDLLARWDGLYREPFRGITHDGSVQDGLYRLDEEPQGAPPGAVQAAHKFLALLDEKARNAVCHGVDDPQWRAWSNPEFVVCRVGVRLEELSESQAAAALGIVRASLSPEGYTRIHGAMALNASLGMLTALPRIMNDRSYWFSLFGSPSADTPWGWQLFGHHVAVNSVFVGGRQVIAPVFLGAEPDRGSEDAAPLFEARERLALELGTSLSASQRAEAVVYRSVLDPAMPAGRLHPADERHVAGAFQDNRVVPYEGIRASDLDAAQHRLLQAIVADALLLLPSQERQRALREVATHLGDTWVSWYGATDGTEPFYLRVHSPVILAELDHHAGVWLSNRLPQRFHVHTTLRLPNGNDYARAYVDQWRAAHPDGA